MENSISVIIPTHGRDDYLIEAIESVINQNEIPLEILVVDDFISKSTEKLVSKIEHSKIKIHYLKNSGNLGAPQSRNIGVNKAKGRYLAFLDDDDTWHKNYLKKVIETISKQKVSYCYTSIAETFDMKKTDKIVNPYIEFEFSKILLFNQGILVSNLFVEKDVFKLIGGFDTNVKGSCDKDIFIQLNKLNYKHSVILEPLVYWRKHNSQWSNSNRRILPNVISFYMKYFWQISPNLHIKMLKKIVRLFLNK